MDYFGQFLTLSDQQIENLVEKVQKEIRLVGMGKIMCPFIVEYENRKWKRILPTYRGEELKNVFLTGIPTIKYDGMNCLKVLADKKHILCIRYDQKLSKNALLKLKSGKVENRR